MSRDRDSYEYGGVCASKVQALLTFYPSLLLKLKFYPIPNQTHSTLPLHCFSILLLKPFLTLPETPPNLSCQVLPYPFYQYQCETGYSMVVYDRVGLHNDYGAFLICILQCATRSKVQILALYTKYKNTPCSCEGQINYLFGKCKV